MKRWGIVAVAGLFAIVGCSNKKKVENQSSASETTQAVAKTVNAIGASSSSTKAPARFAAIALGGARTHGTTLGFGTWDGTFYVQPSKTFDGMTHTIKMQLQDASGNTLGDVANKHDLSLNPDFSWLLNWKKTREIDTGTGQNGELSSTDITASMTLPLLEAFIGNSYTVSITMNGTGTWKEPAKKVDVSMTITNMTMKSIVTNGVETTAGPDGNFTFSGTVDDKTVSGSITFVNGLGDGSVTVDKDTVVVHINQNGTGTWTDSDGKQHNFDESV